MDLTRLVAGLGNTARKGAGVRSRQPLPALLVAGGSTFRELPDWASGLIQDELNVKRVEYVEQLGEAVRQRAEANPKILGPKYGKDYPRIRTALQEGRFSVVDGRVKGEGFELEPGEVGRKRLEGEPAEAEFLRFLDPVLDPCVQAVPALELRDLRAGLVGDEAGVAVTIDVAEAQLRARMRPLPERLPDMDRRRVVRVPQQPYLRVDRNDYSIDPSFAGRRVEVRISQTHVSAAVLDTGELAARHRRCFAGGLTITDPAHQTQLERLRARRRQRHEVDVEIRPLSRYDRLIPA
jgi:hypothetical protein